MLCIDDAVSEALGEAVGRAVGNLVSTCMGGGRLDSHLLTFTRCFRSVLRKMIGGQRSRARK